MSAAITNSNFRLDTLFFSVPHRNLFKNWQFLKVCSFLSSTHSYTLRSEALTNDGHCKVMGLWSHMLCKNILIALTLDYKLGIYADLRNTGDLKCKASFRVRRDFHVQEKCLNERVKPSPNV